MAYAYLDFEANKSDVFYLAGQKINGVFQQTVLHEGLLPLASQKGMDTSSPEAFAATFLETCLKQACTIAAYSTAEASYLRRLLSNEQRNRFAKIPYLNLRKSARRWANTHHYSDVRMLPKLNKKLPGTQTFALASLMRLTDFPPPRSYAFGHTTARFNAVISALKLREADYSKLTPVQKAKATKALAHNRFDVEAMEVLNKVITATDPRLIGDATAPLFN